ncbi:MAG: ATP-binding protein [Gemmatimonadales bacterium]|jgi:serine/threonine-protein kinase RsbW|nr:MAG: ATP-binding protein [Gemmatimonadales bacterium]
METTFVLEVPNDLRAIERAVDLVVGRCQTCESQARRFRLNFRVALAEALANAMLYGNGSDPHKRVRVDVTVNDAEVSARVTDQGAGFDPDAVEDPTTPENLMRPGGRGLFLMRQLLDEVRFNDRGNSVTLILRLEESASFDEAASA